MNMEPKVNRIHYSNGQVEKESWYLKGWHREDGPAVIGYYENGQVHKEEWYLEDNRHREDGPAVIRYYENGRVQAEWWYLRGKGYTEEEWVREVYRKDPDRIAMWELIGRAAIGSDMLNLEELDI